MRIEEKSGHGTQEDKEGKRHKDDLSPLSESLSMLSEDVNKPDPYIDVIRDDVKDLSDRLDMIKKQGTVKEMIASLSALVINCAMQDGALDQLQEDPLETLKERVGVVFDGFEGQNKKYIKIILDYRKARWSVVWVFFKKPVKLRDEDEHPVWAVRFDEKLDLVPPRESVGTSMQIPDDAYTFHTTDTLHKKYPEIPGELEKALKEKVVSHEFSLPPKSGQELWAEQTKGAPYQTWKIPANIGDCFTIIQFPFELVTVDSLNTYKFQKDNDGKAPEIVLTPT